jgi:hypothetical protein
MKNKHIYMSKLTALHQDVRELRASTTEEIRDIRHSTSTSKDDKQDEIKGLRASTTAAIKEMRHETKIEIKAKLDAKRAANVAKVIHNRVHEFQHLINQQSARVTRVMKVSATLKAAGKDTGAADSLLVDASLKLSHASTTLLSINTNATTTASSTNPSATLSALKTTFESVSADLKVVHKDIATAISDLKGLGSVEIHATSTATTTTSL